jgi:hypothetical protein
MVEFCRVAAIDDHMGAGPRQRFAHHRAQMAAPARNKGDAAGQIE